jgi:hypothetical protein
MAVKTRGPPMMWNSTPSTRNRTRILSARLRGGRNVGGYVKTLFGLQGIDPAPAFALSRFGWVVCGVCVLRSCSGLLSQESVMITFTVHWWLGLIATVHTLRTRRVVVGLTDDACNNCEIEAIAPL